MSAIALAVMLALLALEALAFLLEFIGALCDPQVAPQVAPLPERKVVMPPRSVTLRAGERYP